MTPTTWLRRALLTALTFASIGPAPAALVDRGGGMIYDDVLNITWLQDANYAKTSGYDTDGRMNWADAMAWAAQLSFGGFNDWRLPTLRPVDGIAFQYYSATNYWLGNRDISYNITSPNSELAYNFYVNLGNKGYLDKSGNTTGNAGVTNSGPFTNLQNDWYWFDQTVEPNANSRWEFAMIDGYQGWGLYDTGEFAWAVRDGDVIAAVPEPGTLALVAFLLAALPNKRRKDFASAL